MTVCTSEDMHPSGCPGLGRCRHCDRRYVINTGGEGTAHYEHDPSTCALCEPAYDLKPNPHWKGPK